ncbi:hypothetical protein LAZ67_14002480 [Cordylochernes scorpioides]|uniref:Metalloendopeptidase n=1 Tax=Cordylochernes scorpioides TaxID=51811 RepID=A0ABY6L719_9ARAC|nr:hypothetical protein LAZ67_14002480 [Cordylochernes scorpioides]
MVWKKPEESAPKKAKVAISPGKVMAIVFWDCKDVLLVDYLPLTLRLTLRVLLVHDNARPHAARTFKHTPYSPELAPSDFYLFPALKLHLGGKHFANDDEVQAEANHWLRRQDTAWYNSGIKKLLQQCQKCLDRNGDYVEKCYSYVGIFGGKQPLSLGNGCHHLGIIIHEIGHALGFYHEQSRSDRDDYINIYWENIKSGMAGQFKILAAHDNTLYNKFDYESIMIYGEYAFSKDGKSKTMEDKNKIHKLSEPYTKQSMTVSDIERVNKLYDCKK